MVEGNNLAELRVQIHAPVTETGLLCFVFLLVSDFISWYAVYFNNYMSDVVEIFRVVACRIQRDIA